MTGRAVDIREYLGNASGGTSCQIFDRLGHYPGVKENGPWGLIDSDMSEYKKKAPNLHKCRNSSYQIVIHLFMLIQGPFMTDPDTHQEWDEDGYDEDDADENEDDGDIDAEAEEIARRLGEELLADLTKANAAIVLASGPDSSVETSSSLSFSLNAVTRKKEAVIITMKAILALIKNDPLARSSLSSAVLPDFNGENVLGMLERIVSSGQVPKTAAMPLSNVLVSLARSSVLFHNLRHSNASSIQLDKGKRKRDERDEVLHEREFRALKRPCILESDLRAQVNEAVHTITHALSSSPAHLLDPSLVSSIRLQLHQVFLFAVTSSARGGQDMHALQEIGGLIQVIGVLSGIQIGQPSDTNPQPFPPNTAYPWLSAHSAPLPPDIGTAVYPCLVAGCKKTFSRLFSLRSHQRVHAAHRPFRCNACPASFARNHDLKRHVKLHDRKAWRCGGCHKIFSRRDAIKRHKNGSRSRGSKGEMCLNAEIVEVELDEEEGEESVREERRAKLWSGITTNQGKVSGSLPSSHHREEQVEEGELQPSVISGIQSTILGLHGLLQTHVGNALGTPAGQVIPLDPTAGQATLASVIARAQLQTMPAQMEPTPEYPSPTDLSLAANAPGNRNLSGSQSLELHTSIDNPVHAEPKTAPSLSMYGLSDEQMKMLEEAIANAAAAAQAQAEAEAAFEEEEDVDIDDEDDEDSDEHLKP